MSSAALHMQDDTMRLGLLMEAAQAQQTLAATALDRLREHTAGLDAIVREEIRSTFVEEMRALDEESRRASEALRSLHKAANMRFVLWGAAIVAFTSLAPLGLVWSMLPSRGEIETLSKRRDELAAGIERLTRQGGAVDLRHCGKALRLCIRVDRSAPSYGEGGDFVVVKGY
jgi:hypothetical protein